MRKRALFLLYVLFCLMLPTGCKRDVPASFPTDDVAAASTALPVLQNDTSAAPTADTVLPDASAAAETPVFSPISFSASDVSPYTNESSETVWETTLVSYGKTKKGQTVTYENQRIDYADLSLKIVSFSPNQGSEALKMLVSLPESWNDALCNQIVANTLRFSFEVDGKPVDAFRDKTVVKQDAHTYLISYETCLLDKYALSGEELSIRPYVVCVHRLSIISQGGSDSVQLTDGDPVTRVIRADPLTLKTVDVVRCGERSRCMLDHGAVNIALHPESPSTERPPYLLPVSTEIIDWEDSERRGAFSDRDGELPSPTTEIRLCDKDFSDAAFILDALQINETECFIAFTWRFPSSFTDEECQIFARDRLRFYACFDGDDDVNDLTIYAGNAPFGGVLEETRTMFPMLDQPYVTYENHASNSYRDLHFCYAGPSPALETWREHKSVMIVPYYWYFTEINGKSLSADGVRITKSFGFKQTFQSLPELAIHIDITPALLETGF